MAAERLQKLLARAGIASRRAAEQLVLGGRVRVNGEVVRELGTKADPGKDRIEVDGRPIAREELSYFLVHKPRGVVTTLKDPEGRPSLGEYLKEVGARVYPVGRLDFNTSGVLLVTNDGDLAQALLHPSREVPKTYIAKLNGTAEDRNLESLKRGVKLDDGYDTAPARVTRLRDEEGHSWLEITITEGKNRQVHRMVEAIGFHVMRLSRVAFAGLTSEGLRPGDLRPLDPDEIAELKRVYQGIQEHVRIPKAVPRRPERASDKDKVKSAPGERAGARGRERAGREQPAERGRERAEREQPAERGRERAGREQPAERGRERGARDDGARGKAPAVRKAAGEKSARTTRDGTREGARSGAREGTRSGAREGAAKGAEKPRTLFDKGAKPRQKPRSK